MAARNKHVFQLRLSSMKAACTPYSAPQESQALVPQRELQCVPINSVVLVTGDCGLCPPSSKPGLAEQLNSV